jgi:hypothetical protein
MNLFWTTAFYGLGSVLLTENQLASAKDGLALLKIRSFFLPNKPSRDHEDFHEEIGAKLFSCIRYHRVEIQVEVPVDVEVIPVVLAKGTGEEQMKCGFFPAHGAQGAIVVISFQLLLFSFLRYSLHCVCP